MIPWSALSVLRFELRRTLTAGRIAVWLVLAMFPVVIFSLIALQIHWHYIKAPDLEMVWGIMLFYLAPLAACLLGLLLWASPLVQAEVEGKTWIYLAVRPHGRIALLIGKYLSAVVWTALAGWTGVTGALLVVHELIDNPPKLFPLWPALCALVALSCIAYGAVYALIATLLPRRAMVIAVTYTLILEFVVSLIPAIVNKFTVHYRLRCLFITWMDWWNALDKNAKTNVRFLVGEEGVWMHLAILALWTVAMLAAAAFVLRNREYVTSDEG